MSKLERPFAATRTLVVLFTLWVVCMAGGGVAKAHEGICQDAILSRRNSESPDKRPECSVQPRWSTLR